MDLSILVQGIIGGLAYSLSGFASKPASEGFDWSKTVTSLVISAVVGGVAAFTNLDYGVVANSAMAAGFTAIVQKLYSYGLTKVKSFF